MSHLKERKEKICLNCNAQLHGRYCHVCGQENLEPKESFWHLVTHFVYDVTHFDGKFFSTLKYLLFRPGYLSHEYIRGKRSSYLNPIRMYVFVSAIFFLFFLSILRPDNIFKFNSTGDNIKTAAQLQKRMQGEKGQQLEALSEPGLPNIAKNAINARIAKLDNYIAALQKDSTKKQEIAKQFSNEMLINITSYKTVAQYDSAQNALPDSLQDSWIEKGFTRRNIEVEQRYGENQKELWSTVAEKFIHSFPQIMFVSLPLFAVMLQLLYIRRKKFYYVDHVIYSLHLYCAIFVLFFVLLILNKLAGVAYLAWIKYLMYAIGVYIFIYSYKAMRNFYEQRRAKTIFKWILLNISALFIMALLFSIFAIVSFFTF